MNLSTELCCGIISKMLIFQPMDQNTEALAVTLGSGWRRGPSSWVCDMSRAVVKTKEEQQLRCLAKEHQGRCFLEGSFSILLLNESLLIKASPSSLMFGST